MRDDTPIDVGHVGELERTRVLYCCRTVHTTCTTVKNVTDSKKSERQAGGGGLAFLQ